MAIYRIPVVIECGTTNHFEDIDLPLLLAHSGDGQGLSLRAMDAYETNMNLPVLLQLLPSTNHSAIAGQRCYSLLIDACRHALPRGSQLLCFVMTVMVRDIEDCQPWVAGAARVVCRNLEFCKAERLEALVEALADEVTIKETADALDIAVSGKPFVTYRFNTKDPELPRPYFHPLLGPSGKTITQLGEVPGEKKAHFHHTALWIAHQNWSAKGQPACDNWQMNKNCTRIEHVKFEAVESGPLAARFIEKLNWLNHKGDKTLLAETRTVTVPKRPTASRFIDIDIRLTAQDLPVTFNKTPYHLLAVRVLNAMLPAKGGVILNSAGQKNPGDGAAARWIDISGKHDDELQGVALFNHPDNLRQPTPCLLFSGQTIGLSPSHKEPITIEAGKELRFRYRVLVHAGGVEEGKVAEEYEAYCKPKMGRIGGIEKIDA